VTQLCAGHCSGFIAALNAERAVGQVINLGSGFEISIGDAARAIAHAMGAEIEIVTDEQRLRPEKSEVERLFASNGKAAELLGWAPQFGGPEGFKIGLPKTVEWFSDPSIWVDTRRTCTTYEKTCGDPCGRGGLDCAPTRSYCPNR
jgi:UDP-glucose 4-epimerase